ncbi:MAG: hypothetical protein GEU28_14775 [Dehalococcoidia bacterium]|nr:hypothetical protein [Dehalococcoidia bacterium]
MGFDARAQVTGDSEVTIEDLVVRAGLALPRGGILSAPFIGKRFRAGVVTTGYEMATDQPLKAETPQSRCVG